MIRAVSTRGNIFRLSNLNIHIDYPTHSRYLADRQAMMRLGKSKPARVGVPTPDRRRFLVALVHLSVWGLAAQAEAGFVDRFESGRNRWVLADSDCSAKVLLHQRTQRQAHSPAYSEHVRVAAGPGTFLHLAYALRPVRVIDELQIQLQVKSDRAGAELLARVVLPRSRRRDSDTPVSTVIRGTVYRRVGSWEALHVDGLATALSQQMPALRSEHGSNVDAREAYVEAVLLNAFGGPGVSNIWIDDLSLQNDVPVHASAAATRSDSHGPSTQATSDPLLHQPPRLEGDVLLASGQPLLPRIIQWNGESLSRLASLGFNVVWLHDQPTTSQLEEARRLRIWLIVPYHSVASRTYAHERVLALSVRSNGSEPDSSSLADTLNGANRRVRSGNLPLLVSGPDVPAHVASRLSAIRIVRRPVLHSSFRMTDYLPWIRNRKGQSAVGFPCWCSIETQGERSDGHASGGPIPWAEPEQLRALVFLSLSAGCRGVLFESQASLELQDDRTRLRVATLQDINLKLATIEPWLAAHGARLLQTSDTDVIAALVASRQSQLVLAMRVGRDSQYSFDARTQREPLRIIVPDTYAASQAYHVTNAGLPKLRHRRVAGGMEIVVDRLDDVAAVVVTDKPSVFSRLSSKVHSHRKVAVGASRELATAAFHLVRTTENLLKDHVPGSPLINSQFNRAQECLRRCDSFLAANNLSAADQFARQVLNATAVLRRNRWQQAASQLAVAVSSPYAVSYASLPNHWQLFRNRDSMRFETNHLEGGEFEDLPTLMRSGWRNIQAPIPNVLSTVSLSPDHPKRGNYSLLIGARTMSERSMTDSSGQANVLVRSSPIEIPRGQLVRIEGWVRVDKPLSQASDGLMIFDSLGGPRLAHRIRQTNGWERFESFRISSGEAPVTISLALTGMGQALIDGLVVQTQPLGDRLSWSRKTRITSVATEGVNDRVR